MPPSSFLGSAKRMIAESNPMSLCRADQPPFGKPQHMPSSRDFSYKYYAQFLIGLNDHYFWHEQRFYLGYQTMYQSPTREFQQNFRRGIPSHAHYLNNLFFLL